MTATSRFQPVQPFPYKRVFLRYTGGVLLLLAALYAFHAIENRRGLSSWTKLQQQLSARGISFSSTSIVHQAVPPQNDLARLFPLEAIPTPPYTPDYSPWIQFEWMNQEFVNITNVFDHPQRVPFAFSSTVSLYYSMRTTKSLAELSKEWAAYEAGLNSLKLVMETRPGERISMAHLNDPGYPHVALIKNLVEILEIRALLRLREDRASHACDDIRLMTVFANAIGDFPSTALQTARMNMLARLPQPIWEGLAHRVWNADQLAALQSALSGIDLLASYQQVMLGTCISRLETWDAFIAWKQTGNAQSNFVPEGLTQALVYRFLFPTGWAYQKKARIWRFYEEILSPIVNRENRTIAHARINAIRPFCEHELMFLPGQSPDHTIENYTRSLARMQTSIDQARVACAMERFRLGHGRWPPDLNALVPEFLDQVPIDPIDGAPLKYRLSGDMDFALYSVGDDGLDQNGSHQSDWLWTYRPKPGGAPQSPPAAP